MKKILLVMLLMLGSAKLFAQTPNCVKYKEGKFKMSFGNNTVIVKRYNGTQQEFLNGSETPASFTVKWLDDCTYQLIPKADVFIQNPALPRDATITVQIIATTDTSYTAKTTATFNDHVLTGEIYKIKDN